MTKTESDVLQQFILGHSEEEITVILDKSKRTVRDSRYILFKLFSVKSINELCLTAAKSGYAKDLIANLDKIRNETVIEPLGMREVLILQFIFENLPDHDIIRILPEVPDEGENLKSLEEIKASIQQKLKLKDLNNIFFATVVAGYMEPQKRDLKTLDQEKLAESVGNWMTSRKMLDVPLYEFKRKFDFKTVDVKKKELELALHEMRKDEAKTSK